MGRHGLIDTSVFLRQLFPPVITDLIIPFFYSQRSCSGSGVIRQGRSSKGWSGWSQSKLQRGKLGRAGAPMEPAGWDGST